MAGFTKLVPEIVMSSIWNESPEVRCVWIALLATKDENGYVRGNAASLARLANVSIESAKEAIEKFQLPDVESNVRVTKSFKVSHLRHTRKGDYMITDPQGGKR